MKNMGNQQDTTLLQDISNHLADLKNHMAVVQPTKNKAFYIDETVSISVGKTWILDYKGYHYVYIFSSHGFTLTAEDLGTVLISANAWTPVNLQQGQRFTIASGGPYTFLARATDDLYSLGSSGGGGGGGNSTIIAPLGAQLTSASVSVTLPSDQAPISTQRVATTSTTTAGALNAQLVNAVDLSEYGFWSLQISQTAFVGTLTFYGSNDGTNWIGISATNLNTSATASSFAVASGTPNSSFGSASTMRFLQVTMTAYTSGTATGTLTLFGESAGAGGGGGSSSNVTVVGPLGSQASTNGVSVTIASDQAAVAVKESGTWTVQPGNTPNTSAWLVQDVAATSGGSTPRHAISAASTNATSVKASAGMVYGISISNTNAAARYFKIFNKASSPSVGTDTPVMTIQIPANSTVIRAFPVGLVLSTGIAYAATGAMGDSDTTAISAGDLSMDLDYL
jgi:hypothetical protein